MKYAFDYVKEDIAREKQEAIDEATKKATRAGELKGRKEGIKEGIRESLRNLIKRMLENGLTIEQISLYSGSSTEEIEAIKKELRLA